MLCPAKLDARHCVSQGKTTNIGRNIALALAAKPTQMLATVYSTKFDRAGELVNAAKRYYHWMQSPGWHEKWPDITLVRDNECGFAVAVSATASASGAGEAEEPRHLQGDAPSAAFFDEIAFSKFSSPACISTPPPQPCGVFSYSALVLIMPDMLYTPPPKTPNLSIRSIRRLLVQICIGACGACGAVWDFLVTVLSCCRQLRRCAPPHRPQPVSISGRRATHYNATSAEDIFRSARRSKSPMKDHFFSLINHSLACSSCIEVGMATQCCHRLHLVPPWKSMLSIANGLGG